MREVLINAQSSTTTSDGFNIEHFTDLVARITRANHSSGNTVFSFDGSDDGITWVTGIAVLNVTQTTVGTYVASVTLSTNASAAVYIPEGFNFIRAVSTITTDGDGTVVVTGKTRRS